MGTGKSNSASTTADTIANTSASAANSQAPAEPEFITQAASWANIAGSVGEEVKTIDIRSEKAVPRLNPVGRIPSVTGVGRRASESMVDQMRLVFLLNIPHNITIADVSNAIKEGKPFAECPRLSGHRMLTFHLGPLVTIRFGINEDDGQRYAGVIFQYARDAEAFYQVLNKERVDSTPNRFRFIVEAVRGDQAFPADETIRAMGPPIWATRRLTIVKSRFFFIFKEAQLRSFCEKQVGAENIQIIWLYNGGNATVVFAKVEDAIKVKAELDKLRDAAEESSPFHGLSTTYSKDPCVQDLHLVTDIHHG